jgi:hypothetical protein
MLRVALLLLIAVLAAAPSGRAAASGKCGARSFVLWGDGKHDDTAALNAWFRGDAVIWGESGRTAGAQISGHIFRLSAPIYIPSGRGRTLQHFQFVWPERKEWVAGGAIVSGTDPNQPPVATGLTKIGVGPNEGVPFHSETPKPADHEDRTGCLVS